MIVAQAHIHIPPEEATRAGIEDKEEVSVTIEGERSITLERVICRVSSQSGLAMHIDLDEANACLLPKRGIGKIKVRRGGKSGQRNRKEAKKKPSDEVLVTEDSLPCLVGGKLLTEAAARQLTAGEARRLILSDKIILTPSAKDVLRHAGVKVVRQGGKAI